MNDYKPLPSAISNSLINHTEKGLYEAFTHLTEILGSSFPHLCSEITTLLDNLFRTMESNEKEIHHNILIGMGPRATVLRQISEFFPNNNFESVIKNNIPRVYEHDFIQSRTDFLKYVDMKLGGSQELHRPFSRWLEGIPKEVIDQHDHGPIETSTPENLKTGFYYQRQLNDHPSTSQYPDTLILMLSKTQVLICTRGSVQLYLYVPIEGVWAKTNTDTYGDEGKFFNWPVIIHACSKFLMETIIGLVSYEDKS
ncbi:MAG TPA: hypothetical protein VN843_11520 [Anaerolineales bacterium]|nr:hypothetical protein [Anaerolineales bacterium]